MIDSVAHSTSTVLLQGESGIGKELVARAIHRTSQRRSGPLIRLNCAAISSQLADSELFGHEKGAFTGAVSRRAGRFEQADGGTLFLDEVGELSLQTQAKLLRVLQEREFERVGGNDTLTADVRVIAATNRDLKSLVHEGTFRADLYFRLSVVPVYVPPLRDRTSDIPALADRFLRQLEVRLGRGLGRISARGMASLLRYHWPGNVRELQNVIERAAILADDGEVAIPEELLAFSDPAETSLPPASDRGGPGSEQPAKPAGDVAATSGSLPTLEAVERQHILQALEQTRWRLSGPAGAGAVLGMHPNTLRHRMKKLGIRR